MFEKILLAIDESAPSSRAIPVAAALGKRFGGEVVVLGIPDETGNDIRHALSSETLGGAAPLVDRVVMDLKDCGVSARPELWTAPEDDAVASIEHVVRHEAVDLIVMGERAGDPLSEHVRSATRRPVLLVP